MYIYVARTNMLHYVHLHTHAQQRAVPAGVGLAGDFQIRQAPLSVKIGPQKLHF
jgi:hypothetical protein